MTAIHHYRATETFLAQYAKIATNMIRFQLQNLTIVTNKEMTSPAFNSTTLLQQACTTHLNLTGGLWLKLRKRQIAVLTRRLTAVGPATANLLIQQNAHSSQVHSISLNFLNKKRVHSRCSNRNDKQYSATSGGFITHRWEVKLKKRK